MTYVRSAFNTDQTNGVLQHLFEVFPNLEDDCAEMEIGKSFVYLFWRNHVQIDDRTKGSTKKVRVYSIRTGYA